MFVEGASGGDQMDISDIPDLPVPSISSSQENPRRRRSGPGKKESAKEDSGPDSRRRSLERSVEIVLSDEARIYQALRDVAERTLRWRFSDEPQVESANQRLDEWEDWTPEGAASALYRELRTEDENGPIESPSAAVQQVRNHFRDEQDMLRRAGAANQAVEDHLRETLGILLTFISSET